jgi:N-acetylmuramoyl-L-alanine amidase
MILLFGSEAELFQKRAIKSNTETTAWSQYPKPQPEIKPTETPKPEVQNIVRTEVQVKPAQTGYQPPTQIAWADPSNYGERFTKDVNDVPVSNFPIIVLHETSAPASSSINFFQNPHSDESIQASYHTIIKLDGTVIYTVPPEKRAFGAANSVFNGPNGPETVKTHPNFAPSVNNFAYHVSLETPPDGWGQNFQQTHSGYTEAQYHSLAWLIAQSNIPEDRITTHKDVDKSGERIDPRSFDFPRFINLLRIERQ